MFLGEESINKTDIIISNHALERLTERLDKLLGLPEYKERVEYIKRNPGRNGKSKKFLFKSLGINHISICRDHIPYMIILRNLLNSSDHKKAIDGITRTKSLLKYGESFFFRLGKWQFRVARSKKDKKTFTLNTVIWLDEAKYQLCIH